MIKKYVLLTSGDPISILWFFLKFSCHFYISWDNIAIFECFDHSHTILCLKANFCKDIVIICYAMFWCRFSPSHNCMIISIVTLLTSNMPQEHWDLCFVTSIPFDNKFNKYIHVNPGIWCRLLQNLPVPACHAKYHISYINKYYNIIVRLHHL